MKFVETLGKNIANLLKVKTIITLTITFAITYGFIVRMVPVELFAAYAGSIFTYYFNKDKTEE